MLDVLGMLTYYVEPVIRYATLIASSIAKIFSINAWYRIKLL